MESKIYPPTPENISRAAEVIRKGGLVAFPTETVYGLGTNALDSVAVAKIFEVKQRPSFDPLIVHIYSLDQANQICELNSKAEILIKKFWPGALTLVLQAKEIIPLIVTSGLPTVGVRMPSHQVARELLEKCNLPLSAPSANPFGYISPTTAQHVEKYLGNKVDMIIDGGPCEKGIESTILSFEDDKVFVLRHGAIPIEEIEKVLNEKITDAKEEQIIAPGQLKQHYSPKAKVTLFDDKPPKAKDSGYIFFKNKIDEFSPSFVLSPSGDLKEAAAHLFSHLYKLDERGLKKIYVQKVPEKGIGKAIMDRIRKAEGK